VFIKNNYGTNALIFWIELAKIRPNGTLRLLFHSLGLSCLGGAVFLQILVFKDIVQQGYFFGVEHNPFIRQFELGLTIFALVYLVYLYVSMIRSTR